MKSQRGAFSMRHASFAIAVVITFFIAPFPALGKLSLSIGGNVGYYTLPKETKGFIDRNAFPTNPYIWSEAGTNENGSIEYTGKYKHPFPLKTRPNGGVNFGISYVFQSLIGVFLEGCWSSSIRDQIVNQSISDSLPTDDYAIIPHDYRIRVIGSTDQLYVKSLQFCFGLSYAMPLTQKAWLIFAGGIGSADYSLLFRIETQSDAMSYYQNNGHRVYSEITGQGSFQAFGIRYSAFCVKPKIAVEWEVKSPLSVRIGLSYPVSRVEKGSYFTENNYDNSITFYPSKRFWAGNAILDAMVSLGLGKGGIQ
jgi:hypothetical protein